MSDPDRIPAPVRLRAARRRLLVTLTLLGLVVFLWLRSIIHTDTVWFCTVGGQFNELQLSNGIVALRSTDERLGPAEAFVVRYFHSREALRLDGDLALRELPFYDKTGTLFGPTKQAIASGGLFGWPERADDDGEIDTLMHATDEDLAGFNVVFIREAGEVRGVVIGAPYYAVFLVTLLFSLWRLRRWVILRKRARRGLCMECGYNIGHSSERCPECGTPIDRETRPLRRWPRYALAAVLIGILVLVGFVLGRTSANVAGVFPPAEIDPVAARLEGVRATVHAKDMRLDAVVRLLAKTYGANIVVDWRDFDDLNSPKDDTMSLQLDNAELYQALRELAIELGGLTFDLDGTTIRLAPSYERERVTRVYNARRLVAMCEKEWERGRGITVQEKPDNGEYVRPTREERNRAKIEDEIAYQIEIAIGERAEYFGPYRPSLARFDNGTLTITTTRYGQFVASRRLAELMHEAERTAATMEQGKQ